MAQRQLDQALAALAETRDDLDARRDILERAGHGLLHKPALGGQLIARFCAAAEDDPALEDMGDLLEAALGAARMARENRKARGDAFLAALDEAVDLAARRGTLTTTHRMLLARIWTHAGLQAPPALELTREDIPAGAPPEATDVDAMLGGLLDDLKRQTDGDAFAMHSALAETFPALPPGMREHIVAFAVTRPDPLHARLGAYWLLDSEPALRRAAAAGFAQRQLTAGTVAALTRLRSWMPDDAARAALDQVLRAARRQGNGQAAPEPDADEPAWTVESILATLPDGGGAQSFGIALKSGRRRSAAMVLLKQNQGVKDAYVLPCRSAAEQKSLMAQMSEETGAVPLPPAALSAALAVALGEHLPPAPGLIDVAALCGFTELRPAPTATADLIDRAPLDALSAQKRGRLINDSADWWDRHDIVQSWFEDSDAVQDLLGQARSERAMESALWKWLDTRRDWWARLIARGAVTLRAAGHPDADSFAATAAALLDGRELKKIPVMEDVHEQTIDAWMVDEPDIAPAAGPDDQWDELSETLAEPEPPKPERKGELARMLKGARLSPDWIDGYLMGVAVAPKLIAPSRWLPTLLEGAMGTLDGSNVQRFLDLIMLRANQALALAEDGDFARAMQGRDTAAWAAGFTQACTGFKSSWPAKSTGPDDKAMQKRVAEAARTGLSEAELKTLGQWLTARHRRNRRMA
jgi:hypothetical protein